MYRREGLSCMAVRMGRIWNEEAEVMDRSATEGIVNVVRCRG
jgi:hypothetical protein